MSDYRALLDRTTEVLAARTRGFRNLVVAFVVVIPAALAAGVALVSLRPLSGLLLLVPAYGTFLWWDQRILGRWRAELAEAWARRAIDFYAFRLAGGANPGLPRGTVQGMLATLPEAGDLPAEQAAEAGTREAVVRALGVRDGCHGDALGCRAAALAVVATALVASIGLWAWQPLLVLGATAVPWLACHARRRRRLARAVSMLRRLSEHSDFDGARYREILGALDWHGLSPRDRRCLTWFQ